MYSKTITDPYVGTGIKKKKKKSVRKSSCKYYISIVQSILPMQNNY